MHKNLYSKPPFIEPRRREKVSSSPLQHQQQKQYQIHKQQTMAQTLSSAERLPTVLYRTPHNSAVAHQSPLSSAATHGGGARTSSNSSFYPNTFASPSSPILSPVGLRTPVSSTLAKQATPYSSEVDRSGGGSLRGLHGVGVGGDHHSHHGMSTGHGKHKRQQHRPRCQKKGGNRC